MKSFRLRQFGRKQNEICNQASGTAIKIFNSLIIIVSQRWTFANSVDLDWKPQTLILNRCITLAFPYNLDPRVPLKYIVKTWVYGVS